MTDHDVVVIGAGAAGLSAGALPPPAQGRARPQPVQRRTADLDGGARTADARAHHDFIPTEIGWEEALRIVDAIPPAVVRHYAFCGTPEQVAGSSPASGPAARSSPRAGSAPRSLIRWARPGSSSRSCARP